MGKATIDEVNAEISMHLSGYLTRSYPQYVPAIHDPEGTTTFCIGRMDMGEVFGKCFFLPVFTHPSRADKAAFLPEEYNLVKISSTAEAFYLFRKILKSCGSLVGDPKDLRVSVNATDTGKHYPFPMVDVLESCMNDIEDVSCPMDPEEGGKSLFE